MITVKEAQSWSSIVLKDRLTLEYAAVGSDLYLELKHPIPEAYLAHAEFMTLTWPVGGIWKIASLSDNNRQVQCMSRRETDMGPTEVHELAKKVEAAEVSVYRSTDKVNSSTLAAADLDDLPSTLFPWKMQLGKWGHNQHWFLRDVMPPRSGAIEVNSIISVDTVGQTFSADVTWEATIPGITTIRDDSVMRELMVILEPDASEFGFTSVNSVQEDHDLCYNLLPAGSTQFTDWTCLQLPLESTSEPLHHLQISQRMVATFSEEMTVFSFPVDQQKLTFAFSTGDGVRKSLRITPAPVDAESFDISKYKLGNVFDVVYHDKIFVGEINAEGDRKMIRFEMMLERRPGYYVVNVATPAAIITYLCFNSYAPRENGSLIETGDRLQIVLTLLLTAVTFKNHVTSLTPRISYFTTLDKYVFFFFCFVVGCLVAIEIALFPVAAKYFSTQKFWQERKLLWVSVGVFTLVNVLWAVYIVAFVKIRNWASKVLLKVHEDIRVVASTIPAEHREAILHELLEQSHYQSWELPSIRCA